LNVQTGSSVTFYTGSNVTGATSQTGGTLVVQSGGQIGSTLAASGGTTTVQSGGTVQGNANVTTGGTLIGNGTFSSNLYVTGGAATLNGASVSGNACVTSGTLDTSTALRTTVSGTLTVAGGTTTLNNLTVNGLTSVSGGTLNLSNSAAALNAGLNVTGGSVNGSAGTITNTGDNSVITTSGGVLYLRGVTVNGSSSATGSTATIRINPGTTSVDLGNATSSGLNTLTATGSTPLIYNNSTLSVSAIGNTMAGVNTSSANLTQLYSTVDRIVDAVDLGSSYGLVTIISGSVYVTPSSFLSPTTTTPSIQRGVDAASTGSNLWVQSPGATYTGGLTISSGKNVAINTGSSANATVNTAVSGNWSLSSGSSLNLNLSNTTYSNYTLTGATTVNLGNITLNLNAVEPIAGGIVFKIMDLPVGATLGGSTFNGLTQGSIVPIGSRNSILNYFGGDGNDIVLTTLDPSPVTNVLVNANYSSLNPGDIVTYESTNYFYGYNAFASLQSGVSAVGTNYTVTVFSGSYTGTTTIAKNLNIVVPTGNTVTTGTLNATAAVNFTGWTGDLQSSQINVSAGSTVTSTNLAGLIAANGTLQFAGGSTFSGVSLSATRNITITSSDTNQVVLVGVSPTPAIAATSGATNVSLVRLTLDSSASGATGLTAANTGSLSLTGLQSTSNISVVGTVNGPGTVSLDYSANNTDLSFTLSNTGNVIAPSVFGSAPLTLANPASTTFNLALGSGNDTFALQGIVAGGLIQGSGGSDIFTISANFTGNITGGSGTNSLYLMNSGSGVSNFDGGGSATLFGATRNNNFTITGANAGNLNTLLQTNFTNVSSLKGGSVQDRFFFRDGSSMSGSVDGGLGTDIVNFENFGTNRLVQTSFTTACGGSVALQQPGNVTGTVGVIGSFAAIESVVGGQGDDSFLFSGSGSISGGIDGGLGNNTLDYRNYTPTSSTGVVVNLSTGSASLVYGGAASRVSRIRDVYGTSMNDSLTGDAQNNILYGLAGNDNLVGNDGNDLLIGGTGSDTVQGGNGYNIVTGDEINFTVGGTSAGGYGIAGQYYDFVLRSMMNTLTTAVDGTSADLAYNAIESSGVNVQVPGTAGTVGAVRLFAEPTSGSSNGTVFNDAIFDRVVITGNLTDFVFYTTDPTAEADLVVNLSKASRSSIANRRV